MQRNLAFNAFATLGVLLMSLFSFNAAATSDAPKGSAYDFTFDALMSDTPIALGDYRGKVILMVNTASQCGFAPQFKALEALSLRYREQGLVVIGVPSGDFGDQELGSAKEIATFCEVNYGVTFPMSAKYSVSGESAHPFYAWAKQTLGFGTAPKWNFHKYLIGRNGELIDYFNSTTAPDADKVIRAIEAALAAAPK